MSDSTHIIEQDAQGSGDSLPTYEDLSAQKGPNSRFGRWKGWVEKRAAERYQDITREERARRRNRGWGDGINDSSVVDFDDSSISVLSQQAEARTPAPPSYSLPTPDCSPILTSGQSLAPTHLKLHAFGSRFIPHSTAPIRCVLPLLGERLLLIGHDDGLSVLDMFPTGDPETSGPSEAEARPIWEGEGVFQLELLEFEDIGDLTPQGVVLALVGTDVEPPTSKDQDIMRTVRMYNLASLTSLARWLVSQKGARPLDLRRPSNWTPQQTSPKRHRHHSSITKGMRGLIVESQTYSQLAEPQSSYKNLMPSPPPPRDYSSQTLLQAESPSSYEDSAWEIVDDLPLRWATDYVPLATTGSRLINTSVLFFDLWRDEYHGYQGRALLAVATKSNIFLYETPKGQRAFQFLKEFYTPLPSQSITFVHQHGQDSIRLRSSSDLGHRSRFQDTNCRPQSVRVKGGSSGQRLAVSSSTSEYGSQLSLFVVFEKRAGLIRLADSAVGEVEVFSEGAKDTSSTSGTLPRLSRTTFDNFGFMKDGKSSWLPPVQTDLPVLSSIQPLSQTVYIMTRGKQTHILPSPLPIPISSFPPLRSLTWLSPPNYVCHRLGYPVDEPPFLQFIGLGEFGVEVQEISLNFLSEGKGKARVEEPTRCQADVGGDAGFLCHGGIWHKSQSYLTRTDSFLSNDSMDTQQNFVGKRTEQGIYAWCRKGLEDWRVFWLGGMGRDNNNLTDL